MTPQREAALYHLLYHLNAILHLHEAQFYLASLIEANGAPQAALNEYHEQLAGLLSALGTSSCWYFEAAGLDSPYDISEHAEVLQKHIRNIERRLMIEGK